MNPHGLSNRPMSLGSLALVLHAHLPFVRHPEHEDFLEEDWLYEAISETYLPLLLVFERLAEDGVPFRLTMTLTPAAGHHAARQLLHGALRAASWTGCASWPRKEVAPHAGRPDVRAAGALLPRPLRALRRRVRRPLPAAIWSARSAGSQDAGYLEIITCGATHGFLPLMQQTPEAVRAQVQRGRRTTTAQTLRPRPARASGCPSAATSPAWSASSPGRAHPLLLRRHARAHGRRRRGRCYGVYAPVFTEAGRGRVRARPREQPAGLERRERLPRRPASTASSTGTSAGTWTTSTSGPYIQPTGDRKNTGIKYFRITGKTRRQGSPTIRPPPRERAGVHAGNFMFNREQQVEYLASRDGRPRR